VFLQLTTIDPHFPITAQPEERRRFLAPGVPRLLADYRAMLRRADDAMADLERRLAAYGVRPANTLWVVVADHGEGLALPPHHRAQHGRVLYDSLVRVGWVARGPGVRPGTRVTGLASHLDVLPTVLGLAGLTTVQPTDPLASGFDLAPVLRAGGTSTPRTSAATATWYEGAARGALWTSEAACQADWGSVGIAADTFAAGCFDRRVDPTFLAPVENPALSSALDRWYAAAAERGRARGLAPEAPADDPVREQLEALGYAE
jgi:N-acetylglucosamine-6-sulfatase